MRSFPAHTAPALSKEEENVAEITSVHWLKRHKGIKGALLVSFLRHGVRLVILPVPFSAVSPTSSFHRIIDTENEQVVYHLPVRTHM